CRNTCTMRSSACTAARATATPGCALPKASRATGAAAPRTRRPPSDQTEDNAMDFTLSNEQRSWQMAARKFAEEDGRPIAVERDAIPTAAETWDWDIIRKGSRLGFRTLAVPKEWGGHGADFVSQALVMAEIARADSAISKAFSQNWKWSHLISAACTEEQKA